MCHNLGNSLTKRIPEAEEMVDELNAYIESPNIQW